MFLDVLSFSELGMTHPNFQPCSVGGWEVLAVPVDFARRENLKGKKIASNYCILYLANLTLAGGRLWEQGSRGAEDVGPGYVDSTVLVTAGYDTAGEQTKSHLEEIKNKK
jgi:hypothetical protein